MKREIQNASYRAFINNESTSSTMSVSTYFEFAASLLMQWEACVRTYLSLEFAEIIHIISIDGIFMLQQH